MDWQTILILIVIYFDRLGAGQSRFPASLKLN
jgi:hypothetical protein